MINLQVIKTEMQAELTSVINKIANNILEGSQNISNLAIHADLNRNNDVNQKRPLLQLLETVFELFRKIASSHSIVLGNFNKVVEKNRIDIRLYEMPDVWSKIQAVVSESKHMS